MRAFLFLFLSFFTLSNYFGQNGDLKKWDQLIKNEQFDQLKAEFQQNDKSEYSYITFLRSKALSFSQRKEDKMAVKIMQHCCSLANNKYDDCDTIKLNNLHLLGRYYSFANEPELSLQTNKICLNKRLSCKNVDPIDIAKSFNNIGLYFQNRMELDSSFFYFEKALIKIKSKDFKTSPFPNIMFGNYLLNLTLKGEIKKGKRFINKWCQTIKKQEDYLIVSSHLNRNIYECLVAKNIKGAFDYHSINEHILIKLFGNKSTDLFDLRFNFAKELAMQHFDVNALKYFKKVEKKHIHDLPHYKKLITRNSVGTALMNMGYNEEALKIYLEIKPDLIKSYSDSFSLILLLTNLSICYSKLGDFKMMDSTRQEFYGYAYANKDKIDFQFLFQENLDRELRFYNKKDDFMNYEKTLFKSIKFYNEIHNIDQELHAKLKLSNLYLFEKIDINRSKQLLVEVENEINLSQNSQEIKGYFYYQKGELERRMGSFKEYAYYKKSLEYFDSIQFFPVEYENALKRHADRTIELGDFDQGKFLLGRYLEFGTKDSNDIKSFIYKINYLNSLKNYQSDSLNSIEVVSLLNQIERLHGIKNTTYRRAAKFLSECIIENNARNKVLTNWIHSFDSKNDLDYYFANNAIADFYFENGDLFKCDSIGKVFIKDAEVLKIDDYRVVVNLYINNLMRNFEKGYQESLDLLEKIGTKKYDFEKAENYHYFSAFMGIKDYDEVFKYLKKKEEYIKNNYSENSQPNYLVLNDFIAFYETIGNVNLEKYYREKQLDLYFKYQPENKSSILSKTVSLGFSLIENFNLHDYVTMLINRVKSNFTIDIEKTEDINELLFIMLEVSTKHSRYLAGDQSLKLKEIERELLQLQKRCIELKNKNFVKLNNFTLDFIIESTKLILSLDGNFKSMNEKSILFYELIKKNDINNSKLSEFEARKLISEGKIDDALNLAIINKNYSFLSSFEFERGNFLASFNYEFEEKKQELDNLIISSKSLSEFNLEESRKIQKNFLNFCFGRYLLSLTNFDSKANKTGNFQIMKKSFELILNNYGVLSEINKDLYEYIRNSDSTFKNQYYYLSKYNNQKLMIQDGSNLSNETIREIEYKVNLTMFDREPSNSKWMTFEDIQKSLDDSTVFVLNYKFVYNGFDESLDKPKTETYYLTFIVEPEGYSPTVFIDSLSVENEEDIVDYYHKGINKKSEKQDLSFIYEKIWSKIDEQLPNNVKKVILSPDGMYNSINVSTLFDKNNNKYIFDKYEIVIADKIGAENNTKLSQLTSSINSAVLVGFPNYSGTTISDKQNTNDTLKINLDKYYSNVTRGSIAKSLPGTKTEIEKINSLFAKNGIKTTVLMENNATEDNLKKVVSPDVLHIATHGFFINSKEGTPMLNSGLLLAGSNSKTKKIEDGYLSAYETSLLNLENTKLVVLSACETGRGVMKDGDGVFGLKQGCLNAGAQNIIMSLWKVDDKVTQEFMSRFYEIWLNQKTSIREAFNKTQLEIKAKYPQPYYWGAFILVGE